MKRITKRVLSFLFIFLLFLSCKTKSSLPGEIKPFGIIGEKADIYIYIPLKDNRCLVEQVLPNSDGGSLKQALNRTNIVYSGIFLNDNNPEIRICAKGSYPYSMAGYFFKKTDGWNPIKIKAGYTYYEHKYAQIALPSPLISCVVLWPKLGNSMETILNRLSNISEPEFSSRFKNLSISNSNEIGIFVKNTDFFLSQIIGVKLGLPLIKIEMYLKKNNLYKKDKSYNYDLYIEAENKMTATLLTLFLKKALNTDIVSDNNLIIVKNKTILESKIIAIIKSIYGNL